MHPTFPFAIALAVFGYAGPAAAQPSSATARGDGRAVSRGLAQAFAPPSAGQAVPATGWELFSAGESGGERVALAVGSGVDGTRDARWRFERGQLVAEPGAARFAVAAYTVQPGDAGFYAIADSTLRRDSGQPGQVDLRVFVRRAGWPADRQPEPAVYTAVGAGELLDFDTFLGYLDVGDTVYVGIGPNGDATGDRTEIDCKVVRTPELPVSVLHEDAHRPGAVDAPGGWSLMSDVPAGPGARVLAWGRETTGETSAFRVSRDSLHVRLQGGADAAGRESIAAFRVPQSGYYALQDAWAAATRGDAGGSEARLYVGRESTPRRSIKIGGSNSRVSLNTDLGYVEKGEVISLAFTSLAGRRALEMDFAATVIEWVPRRAPLRTRRGADGYLDVYEPGTPRVAVDIPPGRWITVAAQPGDATEAIRGAIAAALAMPGRKPADYVGLRLETGKTYVVGSKFVGGSMFAFTNAQRFVFDGNGAHLLVSSPEMLRKEVDLFTATNCRNLVFADLTVEAISVPFTIGDILDVSPRGEVTQTVTFRVSPGAADPLADISRRGRADGFAYDPKIPGRLAEGTWTHFPGSGDVQIAATAQPGVFTHRVTRTGDSIRAGDKWLIKNKGGGVIYLITQGDTENVTLSGIHGRAAGGTQLRFWQTSGVNILDCRFEPDGDNWISSSADSVHGRGREGVWIENTLIRGICEDVMNTYGQNMVLEADGDNADRVVSIRMFQRSVDSRTGRALRMPKADDLLVGDQLVFFNPKRGRVLGYARIDAISHGRTTLSQTISDLDTWEEGDGWTSTMVYNTRDAGRFFVRDSRLMDSMRFGIFIKARGGVVFSTHFEGLSAPGIFATNEPEWPEGPPATHLWVQGCTFSQNNYGYMAKHRAFMEVDPASVSIYTRRLRDPAEPDDFRAHLTHGQYANSHMKLVGNTFHDWRGMGISVRNSRNVQIADNLFLAPTDDPLMRRTLAKDPALTRDGRGTYAGIYLDSISGVRVTGNHFIGLPAGDQTIVRDQDVSSFVERDNGTGRARGAQGANPDVVLSFGEWFGASSVEASGTGSVVDRVELRGATHRVGRLGAGLFFDGKQGPAVLAASADVGGRVVSALTVALWILPEGKSTATQVAYSQGNSRSGLVLAIEAGRLIGGVWQAEQGAWLDLGPANTGVWRHVALVYDGNARTVRGLVNGLEIDASRSGVPLRLEATSDDAAFGGVSGTTRLGLTRVVEAGMGAYRGGVDEFHLIGRALDMNEVGLLAMRRPEATR